MIQYLINKHKLKETLNSEEHILIVGSSGSGKTRFINKNIYKILNKKILITRNIDLFINYKDSFVLYNYNKINFQYYFTEQETINYISLYINKDINTCKAFFKIISIIKEKTTLKFFNDMFKYYLENIFLFSEHIQNEKNDINLIFKHLSLLNQKIDLQEITSSRENILIYMPDKNTEKEYLKIILRTEYNEKSNIIIDEIECSNNIFDNINKNVKLFLTRQNIESNEDLKHFNNIIVFKTSIHNYKNISAYNFSTLLIVDIANLNNGDFFIINNKKKSIKLFKLNNVKINKLIFILKKKIGVKNININYSIFFKETIKITNTISIRNECETFTIKEDKIDFIFEIKQDVLFLKKVFFNESKEIKYYDLEITPKNVYSYLNNKYFFIDKNESIEMLKILLY